MTETLAPISPAKEPQPTDYPVYFAGGTGYGEKRNKSIGERITAMTGRRAVDALRNALSFDANFTMTVNGVEQQVTRRQAYSLAHTAEVSESFSNFQTDRARDLLDHLESEGIPKADAIFQSADALNGLRAAAEEPDRFGTIILAYPAGLVQPRDIRKAGPGVVAKEALVRLKRRHRVAKRKHAFLDDRSDKGAGTSTIIPSVGLSKQNGLLHEMRSKDNTPGVGMVVGTDDIMLAPERVIASLKSPNDVDTILVVDSPHGINGREDLLREVMHVFDDVREARRIQGENGPTAHSLTAFGLLLAFPDGVKREYLKLQMLLTRSQLISNLVDNSPLRKMMSSWASFFLLQMRALNSPAESAEQMAQVRRSERSKERANFLLRHV